MPDTTKPDAVKRDPAAADKASQNIQDNFLNNARKERSIVTILIGGAKVTGKIKSFDKYSLIVDSNNQEQLIFKHAISTVAMSRPIRSAAPASQAAEA